LFVAILFAPALLLFMLSPSFVEYRKPKDAGPRILTSTISQPTLVSKPKLPSLLNLEEPYQLDVTLKPFLDVIFGHLSIAEVETS
jgi:hypothetical protein